MKRSHRTRVGCEFIFFIHGRIGGLRRVDHHALSTLAAYVVPMRSMAAVYATANSSHQLATKSVISGGLLGAADVACQQSEAAPSAIDWARTARMAAWGLLVNGPSGHTFYRALDKWVRG